MQKSAKDVGCDIIDKRRRNNLQYRQSSNLLYCWPPNERLVDLSDNDIIETKAKQQNHVLKIINKNNNNNKKTMRERERVRDDGDERESNFTRENTSKNNYNKKR